MGLYERIKVVAKEHNTSINKLEKELGFPRSSISKYNTNTPSYDKLQKIADYFNVPIDRISSDKEKEWKPKLTEKDEKDIKNALNDFKSQLRTNTGIMYDGEPLDEEDQEAILAAIEVAERTAILAAKKKFTPNKYKK